MIDDFGDNKRDYEESHEDDINDRSDRESDEDDNERNPIKIVNNKKNPMLNTGSDDGLEVDDFIEDVLEGEHSYEDDNEYDDFEDIYDDMYENDSYEDDDIVGRRRHGGGKMNDDVYENDSYDDDGDHEFYDDDYENDGDFYENDDFYDESGVEELVSEANVKINNLHDGGYEEDDLFDDFHENLPAIVGITAGNKNTLPKNTNMLINNLKMAKGGNMQGQYINVSYMCSAFLVTIKIDCDQYIN